VNHDSDSGSAEENTLATREAKSRAKCHWRKNHLARDSWRARADVCDSDQCEGIVKGKTGHVLSATADKKQD
jgi:hypothetical protein